MSYKHICTISVLQFNVFITFCCCATKEHNCTCKLKILGFRKVEKWSRWKIWRFTRLVRESRWSSGVMILLDFQVNIWLVFWFHYIAERVREEDWSSGTMKLLVFKQTYGNGGKVVGPRWSWGAMITSTDLKVNLWWMRELRWSYGALILLYFQEIWG